MATRTTIELNGKLYDARTGTIIGEAGSSPAATNRPPIKRQGVVLDGFTRRRPANNAQVASVPVRQKPAEARTAPAHVKPKLQRSQTLMRPAVKKPAVLTEAKQPHGKHEQFKKENPHRLARATAVPKSDLVQKFTKPVSAPTVVKKQAVLAVATPQTNHSTELTTRVAQLATSTETHVKQSVDIIEESLRNATAHLERFEGHLTHASFWNRFGFKNKAANIATLSVAGFLLVGFFAFQNAANIEMRLAATRAGVAADMPGYQPSGFSANRGIKAEPGKVTVTFTSNTSDKKFSVTQQASNWSSDSLLSNHVLATKRPFQTYQDEGKTVYIYDNSNATWVNGGIWYRIDGDASLTSDQLLRIANSM